MLQEPKEWRFGFPQKKSNLIEKQRKTVNRQNWPLGGKQ
jgi:hypothetical protein